MLRAETEPLSALSPAAQVLRWARGYMVSQAVYVMAKLGVADHIATGVTSAEALAASTGTDPDALYRLLRVLRDLGVVNQDESGAYQLTEAGHCLRTDHPRSVRNMTILLGEEHYRAWSDLLYSVRSGNGAMERVLGQPVFSYLDDHPEAAASFNRGMADLVHHLLIPALSAVDFGRCDTVMDVGGGTGSVLRHLLRSHPRLRGILLERPDVIADAVPELRTGDLADRCQLVGGDFFVAVPGGADTYLLTRVLHDFDDEPAAVLLANIRAAIAPEGRLVILDRVLPEDGTRHSGHLQDLNMLVANGGRERSRQEFTQLLATAGFQLAQVTGAPESLDVIAALPR